MTLRASDIAAAFGLTLLGDDLRLKSVAQVQRAGPGDLCFLARRGLPVSQEQGYACIVTPDLADQTQGTQLVSQTPRLHFAKAASRFFPAESAETAAGRAPAGVTALPGAFIAEGASIAGGTRVEPNAAIHANAAIGRDCLVKANATIGQKGFGFVTEDDGSRFPFPHLGGVRIGDGVEVGASVTVARGALGDTCIGDGTKIDDQVHIGHNCIIGRRVVIAAGAVLSGGVTVGDDVWISPNATVIDQVTVGARAFIGIGSVVTKSVAAGVRVFGVPARPIGKRPPGKHRHG